MLGDFNIAPTDEDVWDIAEFEGATHVTAREREALAALEAAGVSDVHPRPLKYDVPFTYWDYRQLCFPKNRGMRIDLVYGNEAFTTAVSDAYVDRGGQEGQGRLRPRSGGGRPGGVTPPRSPAGCSAVRFSP